MTAPVWKPNPGPQTLALAVSDVDEQFESLGVKLYVDPLSVQYLEDTEIDYVEGVHGSGFKFNNPNSKGSCGCGSSFSA